MIMVLILANTGQLYGQTYGRNGMVVSASNVASEAGAEVLKKGGNAVDAAVATAFSLAVTWPFAGNIGGGGFIVFMDAHGEVTTFDFREKAPLAADSNLFLDENGNLIPGSNHFSAKAIGVPGTVAGLYMAHQKHGKLSWAEVVQPAVGLAEHGFPMDWTLYQHAKRFVGQDNATPFMAAYFLNEDGRLPEPGEIWRQPALAKTLAIIRDQGRDGFYKGEVAQKIAAFMQASGGIITTEDLEKYDAVERQPVKGTYKDYDIYSMPPPSSGGVALIEMMNIMEQADFSELDFGSAQYVHLLAEAMRRAFADRAEHLGDPDFNPAMPLDKLLSKEHAKSRFANLDMTRASVSDSSRFGQIYDGRNTTHLSVMDKDHNAVSLTFTLEYGYGSKLGSPELGFIFNNEMGDFNPQPGVTTGGGQIGTAPNLIAPEKRMLSSMTPTIIGKNGVPYLVIGSPGGRTIINTVFQTVLNVLEYEMRIDKAIESLKIHHQWLPDRISYEKDKLSPDTRTILEAMGHTMHERNSLGVLMGITYDAEKELLTGAADSARPDGGAVGY